MKIRRVESTLALGPFGAWTLACLVLSMGMWGCNPNGAGCGVALGEWTTDTLRLAAGTSVLEVHGRVDVSWRPSTEEPRAILRAGEGVIQGLSLSESSGTLLLEDNNSCHWSRDLSAIPQVELVGVNFAQVQLYGQGDFVMLDTLTHGDLVVEGDEMSGDISLCFAGDTLQLTLPNGIGHAEVKGTAVRFRSFRSGFGDLNARSMNAQQVLIHHGGLGQVNLQPQGYLFLEVAGHGDVHLFGPGQLRDIRRLPGATGQVVEWP